MKNVALPVAAAVLASVCTLAGSKLLEDGRSTRAAVTPRGAPGSPESRGASDSPAGVPSSLAAPRNGETDRRLAALEQSLATIEARLDSLSRVPVQPARLTQDTPEGGEATPLLASPEARNLVLDVLEEDRQKREAEREAERAARNAERLQERANRIAEELGLSSKEQEGLYGIMLQEDTRRSELFASMRDGTLSFGDRETMRDEFGKIREWKEQEILAQFGPALGEQINDKTSDRGGRGFGGGRDRGGNGGGGNPGDGIGAARRGGRNRGD